MKTTIISILIAIILIMGAFILTSRNESSTGQATVNANNVTVVDGKQIIEIKAKGGFDPSKSVAKAGIPTVLRFETSGTFDCSSSVRIPNLGIGRNLPSSGSTDIDIGIQQASSVQGTCGMGMYPFEIDFKN